MPFEKLNVQALLNEELKVEALKSSYDQVEKEYELVEQIVLIRKQKKISQVELAKKRVSRKLWEFIGNCRISCFFLQTSQLNEGKPIQIPS